MATRAVAMQAGGAEEKERKGTGGFGGNAAMRTAGAQSRAGR